MKTITLSLCGLLLVGCSGAASTAPPASTSPSSQDSQPPPSASASATPAPSPTPTLLPLRIPIAIDSCGGEPLAGIDIGDEGMSVAIDGKPGSGQRGASIDDIACILNALDVTDSVIGRMDNTRALDGMQDAEWNGMSASWTYHPDDGFDLIIEDSDALADPDAYAIATPSAPASGGDVATTATDVVCDVSAELFVALPVLSVPPIDAKMASNYQAEVRTFRDILGDAIDATAYLESESTSDSLFVALYPQSLGRMDMRLGIYSRALGRAFDDGRLTAAERRDIQEQGETIEAVLADAMAETC